MQMYLIEQNDECSINIVSFGMVKNHIHNRKSHAAEAPPKICEWKCIWSQNSCKLNTKYM